MRESIVWKVTCSVVLLLGLYLGGCGNVDRGEVQAQTERGVRTYEILPNTFELRSDTDPTIIVTGEATKYTLVDDGRVLFTANDATGDRNIVLEPDDIVIERPIADSVTIVTQANRLT
jgi:phosphoglucomutase